MARQARRAQSEGGGLGAIVAHTFVHLVLNGALGLDPTAKLILVILAEAANKDSGGVAYPGVETIARRAGVDVRQVQRNLRHLVTEDWLRPMGRTTGGRRSNGGGYATRYRINLSRMTEAPRKGDADATHGKDQRVTSKVAKGDTQDAKGDIQGIARVTPTSPEPEVEPVLTGSEPPKASVAKFSTEGQNPFRHFLNIQRQNDNDQTPDRSGEVSFPANPKNRLNKKTPNPPSLNGIMTVARETDAERIERLEGEKRRQVAAVAARTGDKRINS